MGDNPQNSVCFDYPDSRVPVSRTSKTPHLKGGGGLVFVCQISRGYSGRFRQGSVLWAGSQAKIEGMWVLIAPPTTP